MPPAAGAEAEVKKPSVPVITRPTTAFPYPPAVPVSARHTFDDRRVDSSATGHAAFLPPRTRMRRRRRTLASRWRCGVETGLTLHLAQQGGQRGSGKLIHIERARPNSCCSSLTLRSKELIRCRPRGAGQASPLARATWTRGRRSWRRCRPARGRAHRPDEGPSWPMRPTTPSSSGTACASRRWPPSAGPSRPSSATGLTHHVMSYPHVEFVG
jgi:hypothetical protein